MAEKPEILMLTKMIPMVIENLEREFTLHKLWEAPDPEAFITSIAPRIRALTAPGGSKFVDGAMMSRFPKLEMIAKFGVGYEDVDAVWAGQHGILVTNTPDVLTEEVADLTLGLLIATVRDMGNAERFVRAGKWATERFPLSPSLRDRTVGIAGLGRIGEAVARRLDAMRVKTVYHTRKAKAGIHLRHYPDLVEMARDIDTMIVLVPGGPETNNLITAKVLEALGPRGVLVNVSRGSVVDEPALIAALKAKKILAAGLDVMVNEPRVSPELIALENTVLLPHTGSASVHTRNAMGQLVVDNLVAWRDGKAPLTPVPETPWPLKKYSPTG